MKLTRLTALLAALFAGVALQHAAAQALDISRLSNVYTQNFDGLTISTSPFIGGSLPGEWSVYTNVTPTSIGTTVFMDGNVVDSWTNTAGGFKNVAGAFDYIGGTNFLGAEDPAYQTNEPNRCLAVRQTTGFGDPGASFVLKLANTLNFHNFALSADFLNLDSTSPRTTTWTVEYGYADPVYLIPTSFFPVATYTNVAGAFTVYHTNVALPDGTINNYGGQVWLRISALSASSNSGNRETFGIDNVGLTWDNGTGGFTRVRVMSNPTSITVYSNATATFSVSTAGTAPVSFQWYKNGLPLSDGGNIFGSQTFSLNIQNATKADQGTYSCQVSNADANSVVYTDTSHGATLTVMDAPAANIGYLRTLVDPATFAVTNQAAMWRVTGIITTATNITAPNTASYYIQDSTTGINLFVSGGSSFRPNLGDEVTAIGFLSSYAGSIELYVDITGGTPARNATMVQILSNNIAAYPQPKVPAWDYLGWAPTNKDLDFNYSCSVVLLTNVYFGTNAGKTLSNKNTYYWVTNATGKATQIYFYAAQDNDLTNRTMPAFAYSIQGVLIPYSSQTAGTIITTGNYEVAPTRWLEVNTTTPAAPLISNMSGNQTNLVGTAASFSATVAGFAPLSYQWLKNGTALAPLTPVSGSTAGLNLNSVALGDAATYTLLLSNWVGVATASANLVVTSPATPVTSVSVAPGANNSLNISYAGGSGSSFVLVGTNNVAAPVALWPVVATTNGTTPATFTVPLSSSGSMFFRIKSQ